MPLRLVIAETVLLRVQPCITVINCGLKQVHSAAKIGQLLVVLLLLLGYLNFGLRSFLLKLFNLCGVLFNSLFFDSQELSKSHFVFAQFFELLVTLLLKLLLVFF